LPHSKIRFIGQEIAVISEAFFYMKFMQNFSPSQHM